MFLGSFFHKSFAGTYRFFPTTPSNVAGGGDRGRETGRKEGGRCTGGGRRGSGKRDSQGGGKRKKKGKLCNIARYFAIEKCKGAGAKKYRAGTGIKGYWKREVQPPCPPPPTLAVNDRTLLKYLKLQMTLTILSLIREVSLRIYTFKTAIYRKTNIYV